MITELFNALPLQLQGATREFLQEKIRSQAVESFTGLFHISNAGTQSVVFFVHGKPATAYQSRGPVWDVVPDSLLNGWLRNLEGNTRIQPIPNDGLGLIRLLLESHYSEVRAREHIQAKQAVDHLKSFQRTSKPGLGLVLNNDSSAAIIELDPLQDSPDGLFISPAMVQAGAGVMQQISAWGEQLCSVYFYLQNPASDAWKEFELQYSVDGLLRFSLERYGHFAGRFLLSDLEKQINQMCASQGWDMSMVESQFFDAQFFPSLKAAANAYIRLVDFIDSQMDIVVGTKVTDQIWEQGFARLSGFPKQVAKERLFPLTRLKRLSV